MEARQESMGRESREDRWETAFLPMNEILFREYKDSVEIGCGAFSKVYRVRGKDGKVYALKFGREKEGMKREAQRLEKLTHPLFPKYQDFWMTADGACLITEYIWGTDLRKYMRSRKTLSPRQVAKIGKDLAEGLQYLHDRRIVFRDLKPENVLIQQNGCIRLLDFGCAFAYEEDKGIIMGTPGFAPREQFAAGEQAGFESDVYALGKVMAFLLNDEGEKERAHKKKGYQRSFRTRCLERRVRKELLAIINRCTKEKREERICGMRQFLFCIRPLCPDHRAKDGRQKRKERREKYHMKYGNKKNVILGPTKEGRVDRQW